LGVCADKYLGVSWGFIKSKDIPIGIGANYYDDKGNIVVGGLFYPPKLVNNQVTVPGGVFIGTNLTPFLPTAGAVMTAVPADEMLQNFGKKQIVVDNRVLNVKYFAVDKNGKRDVVYSDAAHAQKYLKVMRKAMAAQGKFVLKAD
jgi:hypothetical protein